MDRLQENSQGGAKRIWKGRKAMKDKRLWILLGGIALIGAAFLLLNFRIAASNTQTEKLIFNMEYEENMPAPMQRKDKIRIVLVGKSPLVKPLQRALTEKIGNAGIGEIELAQELEPLYQNPVLLVKVSKPGPIWTPFFAISQFSVHAGYASDGDPTFMDAIERTHTSVGQKDVANMYAELDLNDISLGLISRPGYDQYLAEYLAQEIVQALKNLYNIQDPTGGHSLNHRPHG
jgi:hypothetical protein